MIETGMTKNDKRKLFVQYIMEGTSTTMNTSICTIFSKIKHTFEKSQRLSSSSLCIALSVAAHKVRLYEQKLCPSNGLEWPENLYERMF